MSTTEKTIVVVTCDSCDAPALDATGEATDHFDSLDEAVDLLTNLGIDWEYFPDTDRWVCDRCRAVEACHAAGGHVWSAWKDSWLHDGTRWRSCVRVFDYGRCPGYQDRPIETAKVKEGVL